MDSPVVDEEVKVDVLDFLQAQFHAGDINVSSGYGRDVGAGGFARERGEVEHRHAADIDPSRVDRGRGKAVEGLVGRAHVDDEVAWRSVELPADGRVHMTEDLVDLHIGLV